MLDGAFNLHFFGAELAREFRLRPESITAARLYPLTDVYTAPTRLYCASRTPGTR